ncbi:MAG TPA: translocation/assembly module TamB domain-containing protein [Terriglobales bacterium]|nr:translocation/assembly module TamB domain-containing protein [Terriglobales bacterium]
MNWKKILGWTAVGILSLILLVVIAAVIALRSPKVHKYVLSMVEQKASAALNALVQVRDYTLNLHNLTLALDGVSIQTRPSDPEPLLTADRLYADLNVISLLRRQWYVNDIEAQHPVVHIYIDKAGNNNLPKFQSSGSSSNTNLFQLGIRHALLSDGEVYYNDQKQLLDADLHDLSFKSTYANENGGRYSGELGYRNGHIQYGHYAPLPHDMDAKFDATPARFQLSPAVLSVGDSSIDLSATVTDYSAPNLDAAYKARLDIGELRGALNNPSLPVGVVALVGTANYKDTPGSTKPLLDAAVVNATLTSPSLAIRSGTMRAEIRNLRTGLKLANGNAALENLRANLLGGSIQANATVRDVSTRKDARVRASLQNLSLADAAALLGPEVTKNVKLTGNADATLEATWHGSMQDLKAHSDSTLQAGITPVHSANPMTVPLKGVVHADYSGTTKAITLTQSSLRTPQTTILLNGTAGERSAMQIRLQANDLSELERVAEAFQTPKPGQATPQPMGLAGTASFNGTLRGSTSNPTLAGQLVASNLQVKGTRWRSLRTDVQLSPSQASLQNGTLVPAGQGRIGFSLSAGLRKWSYTPSNPITVVLNTSNLQLAQLKQLAGSQAPVSGIVNVNVNVHGTQLNPIGQGRVTLANAKVYGEQIKNMQVQFNGTGQIVHATLGVQMPAGNTDANLTYYPKTEGYEATLRAIGFQLNKLQSDKLHSLKLGGVLNLNASGRGTIKNPGLQATLQIPTLSISGQAIRNVNLQTTVQNHIANFALNSDVVNTYVRAKGQVGITGDYPADVTLDTGNIPLQPLFAAYAPAQASLVNGQTELHAYVRGPLKNKTQLQAHLEIPVFRLNYNNNIQLAAAAPIKADYSNGLVRLQPSEITGTGTDLRFQGDVPVSSTAPATLALLGNVDLRIAKIFAPTLATGGQVRFDVRSTGTIKNPNVKGQVNIVNASVQAIGEPIGLQNANGVLTVSNDRIEISKFEGEVGGGTISASGGAIYRPTVQFDLGLKANGITYVYEDQVRAAVDATLAFIGNKNASTLSGRVQVDRVSFTPDFDMTSLLTSSTGVSSPPAAGTFADTVKLDINAQTSPSLNLVSQTLSIKGGANLHVQGTASQPVIVGRVNLTGGDVIFRGNRYVVQQGTIDFVNPNQTQPVVNVAINAVISQYNIAMRFQGPIDRLNTIYTSDPALPPVDILHLLAFGNTTEAAAANASAPGTLGAESMLASGITGYGAGQLGKLAGLSYLSVDPVLGGAGQNPGARVQIQKRVTSNIYVTFATDVTSTQRQEIQVQYQINPRWSVSADRDQNGGFGFDARLHKKF